MSSEAALNDIPRPETEKIQNAAAAARNVFAAPGQGKTAAPTDSLAPRIAKVAARRPVPNHAGHLILSRLPPRIGLGI